MFAGSSAGHRENSEKETALLALLLLRSQLTASAGPPAVDSPERSPSPSPCLPRPAHRLPSSGYDFSETA